MQPLAYLSRYQHLSRRNSTNIAVLAPASPAPPTPAVSRPAWRAGGEEHPAQPVLALAALLSICLLISSIPPEPHALDIISILDRVSIRVEPAAARPPLAAAAAAALMCMQGALLFERPAPRGPNATAAATSATTTSSSSSSAAKTAGSRAVEEGTRATSNAS